MGLRPWTPNRRALIENSSWSGHRTLKKPPSHVEEPETLLLADVAFIAEAISSLVTRLTLECRTLDASI